MAHIHSVYDTDKHFSIEPSPRALINQTPEKANIIQFDHNSERITFEIPRTIEGHDMTKCNVVQVHYLNIDAETKATNSGLYEVEDLQTSPADDTIAICSWLISQNATQLIGPLYFLVTFKCVTDDVDYVWSTAVYKGLSVSEGINNSDYVAETYADILEKWRKEIYGGYYTPTVSQVDDSTMEISFTPSVAGMPEVEDQKITLPAGPQGPQGETGPQGDQGPQGQAGADGQTPTITIGTVETLEAGEAATASITGESPNLVLNLGLPKGDPDESAVLFTEQELTEDQQKQARVNIGADAEWYARRTENSVSLLWGDAVTQTITSYTNESWAAMEAGTPVYFMCTGMTTNYDGVMESYEGNDGTYLVAGNRGLLGIGDDTGEFFFIYGKEGGTQFVLIIQSVTSSGTTAIFIADMGVPETIPEVYLPARLVTFEELTWQTLHEMKDVLEAGKEAFYGSYRVLDSRPSTDSSEYHYALLANGQSGLYHVYESGEGPFTLQAVLPTNVNGSNNAMLIHKYETDENGLVSKSGYELVEPLAELDSESETPPQSKAVYAAIQAASITDDEYEALMAALT